MQQQQGIILNWGHGIFSVILIFLFVMSGMVYVASRQTNEMVDDHYYQKELAYQGVIDAGKNLKLLTHQSLVSQSADKLTIQFPPGSYENILSGQVELQRNDAIQKDLHLSIPALATAAFEISKSSLTRGVYRMKVSWINRQIPYYYEETFFLEK